MNVFIASSSIFHWINLCSCAFGIISFIETDLRLFNYLSVKSLKKYLCCVLERELPEKIKEAFAM